MKMRKIKRWYYKNDDMVKYTLGYGEAYQSTHQQEIVEVECDQVPWIYLFTSNLKMFFDRLKNALFGSTSLLIFLYAIYGMFIMSIEKYKTFSFDVLFKILGLFWIGVLIVIIVDVLFKKNLNYSLDIFCILMALLISKIVFKNNTVNHDVI